MNKQTKYHKINIIYSKIKKMYLIYKQNGTHLILKESVLDVMLRENRIKNKPVVPHLHSPPLC